MARIDLSFTAPQSWAHGIISTRQGPTTLVMPWGRGSGKSWFSRTEGIWLTAAKYLGKSRRKLGLDTQGNPVDFGEIRGVRIVGLCPTLKQFRDIHGAALEAENGGQWSFLGGRLNRSTLRIDWPDGSWFQPMPAAAASSKSGRGIRCDVVLPDEADDIDIETFDSVVRPWFSEGWSLKLVLAGGTPRRGRHGLLYRLHRSGISTVPMDARYFSRVATYRDSPELVDPREVDDARRNMSPTTFAREWECDFDSSEGLVFNFSEDFHVKEPPPGISFQRRGLGIDHGWEDPGVFLEYGIIGHGEDAILWINNEHYHQHKPNHEWDELARSSYYGWKAWADRSRPDRIADLRRAGLEIVGAENSIEAGIARLAQLMAIRHEEELPDWSRFYVNPRCVNLIRELKSYRRKQDPHETGKFLEAIEDRNNHAIDCARYIAISEFGPYAGSQRTETPDA